MHETRLTGKADNTPTDRRVSKTVPFPEQSDLVPVRIDLSQPYLVRSLNCTANKPLHLGHLRNVVLGAAMTGSLRALGADVINHCILEDTGRFMTEAMAAVRDFERSGEESNQQLKTDHFVGACYRRYREKTPPRKQTARGSQPAAATTGYDARGDEADQLMVALLRNDEDALTLRDRVRRMATQGQQQTLQRIGVGFDYCDYESIEDPGINDFIARCVALNLLRRNTKGELEYFTSKGRSVRLVNQLGLPEESLRLLSFNCRLAGTWTADHITVIVAGSEWKKSMTAYAEILSHLTTEKSSELYVPTFYGMVLLDGKKMASSIGVGLLVDHLIDKLVDDERIVTLVRQHGTGAGPDEYAAMVTKCFLLSFKRIDAIDFTFESFNSLDANPGWRLAAAWAKLGARFSQSTAPPSDESRLVLLDAVARISFEAVVERAKELAARILDGSASKVDKNDFAALIRALAIVPRRSEFVYRNVPALGVDPE